WHGARVSMRDPSARPRSVSPDQTLAPRPYGVALAISTASSSVANAITAAAGPNVSSAMTGISRVTLISTVGAYQPGPSFSRPPPVRTFAPAATEASTW